MGIKVNSVAEGSVVREQIDTTIKEGLRDADEVFVILTDNSVKSPGLMTELGAAVSLGKRVTPVALGVNYRDLPPMVSEQYIRYADLPKYPSFLEKRAKGK
jgi:TIR domain